MHVLVMQPVLPDLQTYQPRPQSSPASRDVTSPVKLAGRIRPQFQASFAHSHSAKWLGDEAGFLLGLVEHLPNHFLLTTVT